MKINRRSLTVLGLAATIAVTGSACQSKRSIDPDQTGSVTVPGTSWQLFCDGPNAFIWIPGISGEADELEAVIYDHHSCVDDGLAVDVEDPTEGDPDGVVDDEDE